jgi:hypothetical protein
MELLQSPHALINRFCVTANVAASSKTWNSYGLGILCSDVAFHPTVSELVWLSIISYEMVDLLIVWSKAANKE